MPQKEGRQWNSTLPRRKASMRRSAPPRQSWTPGSARPGKPKRATSNGAALQRTPLNKVGKKGRANQKANKEIDAEAARHGITFCEAGLQGCLGAYMLTRAHSKKRRNIVGTEITEAIYACVHCHDIIEGWPEHQMTAFVRRKIAERV